MNYNNIIEELGKNKFVFRSLLGNLSEEMYIWKQFPEKWCLLEIVCHLYDEEREDFRARVKLTLENPEQPLSPIDPQGWVASRKYIEQDYNLMLEKFLLERESSVKWLREINDPKWDNKLKHPKRGDISASKFFMNWLAHDYLHIRQIIRLKYDYLKFVSGENLDYAGEW